MNNIDSQTNFSGIYLMILFMLWPVVASSEMTSFDEVEKQIASHTLELNRSPDDARRYILRGDLYFLIHEFDEAVEDYTAAIELDSSLDAAYFGRGLAYGRQGYISEGIEDLSHYIKLNPQSSLAYTKRGVRYLWLGDRDNAFDDLSKAVMLDPENAEAHDDLGVVLAQKGSYKQAIKHFSATIRIEPDYQKGYHNLAMAYYVTENDALALDAVNESLRLKSTARNSLLLKAKILIALGKVEEAAALEEDAEFMPDGDWSEQAPVQ
ncbi:MAG TPA: tetratricopeptide repeat protein [Gammaproteobacteria bacterium]|nr:tetratricopeptide repeat protein [Gammaproteobacteria bacterium]